MKSLHDSNRNWREFQTFYTHPCSGTDSAQWDWGITEIYHLHMLGEARKTQWQYFTNVIFPKQQELSPIHGQFISHLGDCVNFGFTFKKS